MRRRGQGLVLSKRKRRQNSNLPANIYLFKFSNRNTRKSCSDVFIVDFEHILDLFLVFLLFSDFEHEILAELVSCCDIFSFTGRGYCKFVLSSHNRENELYIQPQCSRWKPPQIYLLHRKINIGMIY